MKTKNQDFDFSVKGKNRNKEYSSLKDLLAISEEVYSARIALRLSQQELAKKVGTTQKVISKIENAEVNFGIDLMLRISRELKINLRIGEFSSLPGLVGEQVIIHNFVFRSLEDVERKEVIYGEKNPYYDKLNLANCWQ